MTTTNTTNTHDADLMKGLQALFSQGETLFDSRKLNSVPHESRFQKGHKTNRRYGIEDVALMSALRFLGFTYHGIKTLYQKAFQTEKLISDMTIRRLLQGESSKDLRTGPVFERRREHYISFFEPVLKAQGAGWQPNASALQQSRHAPEGSFYKGGR